MRHVAKTTINDKIERNYYREERYSAGVFIRTEIPIDADEQAHRRMVMLGEDIERAVRKARHAGYDVEVVRVPVPPWAMGRVQTHVRIWARVRELGEDQPVYVNSHPWHGLTQANGYRDDGERVEA